MIAKVSGMNPILRPPTNQLGKCNSFSFMYSFLSGEAYILSSAHSSLSPFIYLFTWLVGWFWVTSRGALGLLKAVSSQIIPGRQGEPYGI